ncbi:MAG: SpoIIE family protein phosphatase [Desulfovibrionales bacterium]
MFRTLQSKLILMILLILALNAGIIIFFTMRDVGQAMLENEKKAAQNIFHLVRLNLEEEYSNLLDDKLSTIKRRKSQLKNYSDILISGIRHIAENEKKDSREKALEWIRETNGKFAKAFIAGPDDKVLYYPEKFMLGRDISGIKDIKDRSIPEIVESQSFLSAGKYTVFSWDEGEEGSGYKQFAYFESFAKWDWIIGTLIDISDIEAEAQKKLESLIKSLDRTFGKINIVKSGELFLFNKQLELVIEPQKGSISPEKLTKKLLKRLSGSSDAEKALKIELDGRSFNSHTIYFKSLDWYVTAMLPVKEIKQPARNLVIRQSLIICSVFVLGIFLAICFVRRISRPLQRLAAYVKTVPEQDFTADEEKKLPIDDLPGKHRDEVGALAESFMYMHSRLRKNVRELMETTATKQRIQGELNVARDIQLGILPKIFPPFPERKEFELHASIEPAKEVGGDFYDFYFLDEGHLCITIGDVSDKGAPAALFMAIAKTLIKSYSEVESSPSLIMEKVNNDLSQDNPNCMFVTLFIGVLDISTGSLAYANAGHNPPIILSNEAAAYYLKGISGPVAGAMEQTKYKELEITLSPGEGIFLYTDGVTEAMDTDKNIFSDERLLKLLQNSQYTGARETIETVKKDVAVFTADAPQSDDITMLMLWYNGIDN